MTPAFSDHFPPRRGRTHEVFGPGAPGFAFALGGHLTGQFKGQSHEHVLWIVEGWQGVAINPVGFSPYLDPACLLLARAGDPLEALAVAEEALRSGALALVVIEVSKPLGLTAGRRLQLAAEAGNCTGLCLIPEGMGSNAAQTRWHCAPVFDPAEKGTERGGDSTLQHWEIKKNKSGTLGFWEVRWDEQARRIIVVSTAGQRPGVAGAAG